MSAAAQQPYFISPIGAEELPSKQWFAVHTASRHEKRVAEQLNSRQIEYFLPLYATRHRWSNGMTVDLKLPLFPGYLFARFQRWEDRVRILQVTGVFALIGGPGHASTAISDSVIEELRQGLHARRIEPHYGIKIGESVRIRSGLMAGMSGTLIRRKKDLRVVILLNQIMQHLSVEVDETMIERLR